MAAGDIQVVAAMHNVEAATNHMLEIYGKNLSLETEEGRALSALRGKTANLTLLLPECLLPLSSTVVNSLLNLADMYAGLDYETFYTFLPDILEEVKGAAEQASLLKDLFLRYKTDADKLSAEVRSAVDKFSQDSSSACQEGNAKRGAAAALGAAATVTGLVATGGVLAAGAALVAGAVTGAELLTGLLVTLGLGGSAGAACKGMMKNHAASQQAFTRQAQLDTAAALAEGHLVPAADFLSRLSNELHAFYVYQKQTLVLYANQLKSAQGVDSKMKLQHSLLKVQVERIRKECVQYGVLNERLEARFNKLEQLAGAAGERNRQFSTRWREEAVAGLQRTTARAAHPQITQM